MPERDCYNCKHHFYCFLKLRVEDAVFHFPGLGFIDVDAIKYGEKRGNFFSALAAMCKEYKNENEEV